jgi:hypothetical protein
LRKKQSVIRPIADNLIGTFPTIKNPHLFGDKKASLEIVWKERTIHNHRSLFLFRFIQGASSAGVEWGSQCLDISQASMLE